MSTLWDAMVEAASAKISNAMHHLEIIKKIIPPVRDKIEGYLARTALKQIQHTHPILDDADEVRRITGHVGLAAHITEARSECTQLEDAVWKELMSDQSKLRNDVSELQNIVSAKDEEIADLRAGATNKDEVAYLGQSLEETKTAVATKDDIIKALESMVDDERSKSSSLEEMMLKKETEIAQLRARLQSSDRHRPKAEYKKLTTKERAKLKLDRRNPPCPPASSQQLDEAQDFKSSLPLPAVDTDSIAHRSDVSLTESLRSTTKIYQVAAEDTARESPIELPVPTNGSMLEQSSLTTSTPMIRDNSPASSIGSIQPQSSPASLKGTSKVSAGQLRDILVDLKDVLETTGGLPEFIDRDDVLGKRAEYVQGIQYLEGVQAKRNSSTIAKIIAKIDVDYEDVIPTIDTLLRATSDGHPVDVNIHRMVSDADGTSADVDCGDIDSELADIIACPHDKLVKSSSSIESISSVSTPSLRSTLHIGNPTSKPNIVLDDTASTSTVDDEVPPDPKIFVMSSLRSSAGTSVVLTDDLAPDPPIVPSTQPPATAVVLSDELAPD